MNAATGSGRFKLPRFNLLDSTVLGYTLPGFTLPGFTLLGTLRCESHMTNRTRRADG